MTGDEFRTVFFNLSLVNLFVIAAFIWGGDIVHNLINKLKEDVNLKPFLVQSCTDVGKVRSNNEDYHKYHIPKDKTLMHDLGSLFIISDGVGGNSAGEVASAEAVNVLLQEYYFGMHPPKVTDRLKSAFQNTAVHLYDLASSNTPMRNMKCTLSALLIKQDKFFITHIGDSKIFLLRANKMLQLTKDHSLVGKLVRLGLISEEEARVHPSRHVILKALGDQPIMPPDFYTGRIMVNDVFCLVTDGILEHLTAKELKEFLIKDISKDGLKKIINESNKRGGYDNMTIMAVKVKNIK